jgi:tetraacyldisaccharide 4'-kinase
MDPTPVWYGRHPLSLILLPLSWLYCVVVQVRRLGFQAGWFRRRRLPVPVIVVGNLTVGGTGKTPLVLCLAALLREHGWAPAILTRGYGGTARHWPQVVSADSDPVEIGDEPLLLARRSGCLVVAGPDRAEAGELALLKGQCDILLTDDGLQHYRLARDLEIALVDGERGFGNGRCLPAGPLREPVSRLQSVDLVLYRDGCREPAMRLVPGELVNLLRPELTRPLADFHGQRVCAVAGIGHPQRFFELLEKAGIEVEPHPYPDHYRFSERDLSDWPDGPVFMTEKDSVKCAAFGRDSHWYLPVDAVLDDAFLDRFFSKLGGLTRV